MNKRTSLNADFSVGSGLATYTASRSASNPATYIDASGVVQLVTTSDVPRYAGGYYDETGFHAQSGLMVEGASTNLIPKASVIDDATWTETTSTADNADVGSSSPNGTATAPSLTASAGNGNLLLTTAVTARTFSVWLKRKTGTGTINITADGGTTWAAVTLTSSWGRFQVTAASASQKCGIQIVTNGDAVYVWGAQFESSFSATSFIPTTTVALTRNTDRTRYFIANNRTVGKETILIKYMLNHTLESSDTAIYGLHDTDTKRRVVQRNGGSLVIAAYANANDNISVMKSTTTPNISNVSYVHGLSVQHSSPYLSVYHNGVLEGTYTVGDFIDNAWGTYFSVGGDTGGTQNINGLVQSVAIFNRALTASEVLAVTNILNQ